VKTGEKNVSLFSLQRQAIWNLLAEQNSSKMLLINNNCSDAATSSVT